MGTLPDASIIKGENKNLEKRKLHHIIEERLQNGCLGDDLAIIFEKDLRIQSTTYSDLNDTANKLARSMLKIVHEGQLPTNSDGDYIVAVSMLPSDKLLITLLAIWKCGAAYLPLDPTFPEQRIRHILKESRPVFVVHDEQAQVEFFEGTKALSYDCLSSASETNSITNIPEMNSLTQSTENLAIVLYTSGSTGVPKGVRLPHDIIMNRLQWQFDQFPYSRTERVCVFKTALTFVDSVCEIWGPLINGLTILVIPKEITRDPQKLAQQLTKYKIERLVLVPTLLRSLLLYLSLNDDSTAELSDLRLWISSGEPLTVSLAEDFFEHFGSNAGYVLCNFYGSTEVMGDVTFCSLTGKDSLKGLSKIPIGKPLDNTIIYLLDDKLQPVPKGQNGELWVSGCNLAAGYVNGRDVDRFIVNPMAQHKAYSRLYRTGDFAKYENGTIFYEGRTDSQIKIRGHRVDLSEVEKAVVASEGVEKGVVLCYRPGELDQALLAFVTAESNRNISGLQIEKQLKDKLAAYMIPQVVVLDSIPLLVNGKVDRQSLLKMYENTNNNDDTEITLDIDYAGVPQSQMAAAEALFTTIGQVIGRSTRNTLSIGSNYYELGGNSLNSIYAISRLRELGYSVGVGDFIGARCLGDVLDKMVDGNNVRQTSDEVTGYYAEPLRDEFKDKCLRMTVSSFYEKAELEQFLKSEIKETDYADLIDGMWHHLVADDLSFVVKDSGSHETIAVSINLDVRNEPEFMLANSLAKIFEFLEYVEAPIREEYLSSEMGKTIHSCMMATDDRLTPQENISAIQFMEEENMRLARRKGFTGIFTTNTSPLTQQLGEMLGYEVLLNYKINQYVSPSGQALFAAASDDYRAMVSLKKV